jgi:Flp pilus assembly protein TadG
MRRRGTREEGGQSMVEFTIVLLPLLLVLFGIIEFGLIMFEKVSIEHDAREAGRLAAVNDPAGKTAAAGVTFTCTLSPSSGNSSPNVGDTITAHVPYTYTYVVPLLSSILGSSVNLASTASFRLEGQPTNYAGTGGC